MMNLMLKQVADGVLVHASAWVQSNAVVVQGRDGVLLIDPGISGDELDCLTSDLSGAGMSVVAGFSTHPHWDHLLWHPGLGDVPRYATASCADTARARLSGDIAATAKAAGIPDDVPLELLGQVAGLPPGATRVPWDGPAVRIIEHQAHAAGHAALLVEDSRVLVAGDMLSDVLVPMLNPGADDPLGDYLTALDLIEATADAVDVVVPGHGSVANGEQVRARIDQDRTYVRALLDRRPPSDPRIGPGARAGREWVNDVHEGQLQRLAAPEE
jgi:glyoxylase-like metal-dependent hydrolase (beta-lactamase superfamily II)